jgi:hypothetical protein
MISWVFLANASREVDILQLVMGFPRKGWGNLSIGGSRESENQGAFHVEAGFDAKVFNAIESLFSQGIEAKTVFAFVVDFEEFSFESGPGGVVGLDFEDRELDASADSFAGFGDLTQTATTGTIFGVDVIGDEDEHGRKSFKGIWWRRVFFDCWIIEVIETSKRRNEFRATLEKSIWEAWWIGVEVATEVAGKKGGLQVRAESPGGALTEKRVGDFFSAAFLPGGEDDFAAFVSQKPGTGFLAFQMFFLQLPTIDQGDEKAF